MTKNSIWLSIAFLLLAVATVTNQAQTKAEGVIRTEAELVLAVGSRTNNPGLHFIHTQIRAGKLTVGTTTTPFPDKLRYRLHLLEYLVENIAQRQAVLMPQNFYELPEHNQQYCLTLLDIAGDGLLNITSEAELKLLRKFGLSRLIEGESDEPKMVIEMIERLTPVIQAGFGKLEPVLTRYPAILEECVSDEEYRNPAALMSVARTVMGAYFGMNLAVLNAQVKKLEAKKPDN
jgi:hypothetical protein